MNAQLEALREAVTAHLAAQADFAGVAVLSRKTGELANELERTVGQLGVLVLVLLPQALPRTPLGRQPVLEPVRLRIRCLEDKQLNATGKSAAWLAERALAQLWLWQPAPGDAPGSGPLLPAEPGLVELSALPTDLGQDGDSGRQAWECHFTTRLVLDPAT